MAQQKGIIPLVGTIGGINFYYLNGKPIARRAGGGFNSKAIKTKASMHRVRENASEFGHCSKVNKMFRHSLMPFYAGHRFTFFHSRLMRLFTNLKDLDTHNARGRRRVARGVATAMGKTLLQNFVYTPDCSVRQVLPFDFNIESADDRVILSDFSVRDVKFVSGATHVELLYGVLQFNFDALTYELHLAPKVLIDRNFGGDTLSFIPSGTPSDEGTSLYVFGLRFYQAVDGALYVLNAAHSVGLSVLKCV